jgi:YD repeat-containing protein
MSKKVTAGLIFLVIFSFASPLWAQSGASVQYVYDALGRLTTVVDPSGNVVTYAYLVPSCLSLRPIPFPASWFSRRVPTGAVCSGPGENC